MAASPQISYEKGKLYDLPLAELQPDPDQPRKYFDEQALAELQASIAKHGVLQPVLVREKTRDIFPVFTRKYAVISSLDNQFSLIC